MLKIYGEDDQSREYSAAKKLADIASKAYPQIYDERNVELHILPSIQCYGQQPQDIDLLVLFADHRQIKNEHDVHSFALTVEVKSHSSDDVRFEGAKCFVTYNEQESEVTKQSENQKYSVRDYIKNNRKSGRAPFIHNVIWLMGVPDSEIPKIDNNILGASSTWEDFCGKLSKNPRMQKVFAFGNSRELSDVCKIFSQKIKPSKIDRKRMEKITQRVLDAGRQQYAEKLGKQLLIFSGRGGTGKTVRLVQIANQVYDEKEFRVVILTYNKALVADIKRLLMLLGMKNYVGGKGAEISTIHSFMRKWLVQFDVMRPTDDDYIANYEKYKDTLLEYLKGGALTAEDIHKAKTEESRNLAWDLILIDESQDWPTNERDLIYELYGYEKVIIADGVDQFVRSVDPIDWQEGVESSKRQTVSLKKSLRLKLSLCQAVKHFADEIELSDWNVEPLEDVHGGKIIVVFGNALSKKFHDKLRGKIEKDGNAPIDMLFCVPPNWVQEYSDGTKISKVARRYEEWGFDYWDAVDPTNRDAYPSRLSQCRIVQYESCRGLEGWVVVNVAFDEFFELKKDKPEIGDRQKDMLFNKEEAALDYAKRWVMIPLTRAIDTLVLHVSNENSYVGEVLTNLHQKYPETVELRRF